MEGQQRRQCASLASTTTALGADLQAPAQTETKSHFFITNPVHSCPSFLPPLPQTEISLTCFHYLHYLDELRGREQRRQLQDQGRSLRRGQGMQCQGRRNWNEGSWERENQRGGGRIWGSCLRGDLAT